MDSDSKPPILGEDASQQLIDRLQKLRGPNDFTVETVAELLALAQAGVTFAAAASKRIMDLGEVVINRNVRGIAIEAADKVLMDISQILGGVQVISRKSLEETPGIYMEFSLNNLRFSYTNRQGSFMELATLDVSSVGEYRIIEFTLEIAATGLTVDQLNRIEKADYDASWAGYGDNLVKYASHPQRLAEIYPPEVLRALEPELLGMAVSVDFFGSEGQSQADVLNIEAYRVLRKPSGISGEQISPPERDAAIIRLAERFPELHHLFGGHDNPPSA